MPVTLAQAKLNATDDIDTQVIDEFAKNNFLLQALTFDDVVNQAGAGATMTYGYTRLVSQADASFRAINSEYTPAEVTKARYTVDLKPLGGSFQIDRVLNRVAAAAETTLQMTQKIKATNAKFNDAVINGDTAVDANGFDGLSKSLTASSTEYGATLSTDWRGATIGADLGKANDALDALDAWLAMLDGTPDAILGNIDAIARIRSLARRAGYFDRSTSADFGSQVETYRGIALVDLGAKAGSNNPVIPTTSKTVATVAGNYTDIYAIRFGLDGFHGVSMAGAPLVQTWLPDFSTAGAVKTGEVELGPAAVVLKATKSAAVFRNILVR
ncbi:major capsid protein [Streptomyces sp. NPDC058299]|uniref:major capsid protein n=1 Tax=unclassified Streptomyces TaxID=2593676 RepID=UPI0036E26A58